ncbi:hypothetical protein BJV78DRAFT_1365187 [Lactifluus subvellereus]|nr:hypothetical protein BJV78DRAFT_1365187 [Lactifluus subvellereus]
MSDAQKQLLLNEIHKLFNDAISYNLYTGLAYGMFLAAYFISIRILLVLVQLSRTYVHVWIHYAYLHIGYTVIVVGPELTSQGIPIIIKLIDPSFVIGWSPHKIDVAVGIVATPILSDMVCAWRAIALWKYDRRVVTILSACVLGTVAACVYDLKLALKSRPGTQGEQGIEEGKIALIVVGPMLGTNILSTLLIAWKAWKLRRTMGAHFKKTSPSGRMENVLALLIESGLAYCLLWIIYLFSAFGVLPGSGSYIVNVCMLFISSMYPAVIIIIVCMQIGQEAYTTKPERSIVLDLTTVQLTIGDSTVDSSMPATVSGGSRTLTGFPSP